MSVTQTIRLTRPIERASGDKIEELVLREPAAGELRGLSVKDLLTCEVDAVMKLVPRIAVPAVIREEVEAMHPADLAAMAGEIVGFFLTPEQQAKAEVLRQTLN